MPGASVQDEQFRALGALGFSGSIQDRTLAWLLAGGATSPHVSDAWIQIAQAIGSPVGSSLNEHKMAVFAFFGHTQPNFNDRELSFWSSL